MDALPLVTPLPAHRCPLCGGPNGCAAAAAGRFDVPCWCAEVRFTRRDGTPPHALQRVIDAAVRRAYTDARNPLRASMVRDPLGQRGNTRDNTPAVVHCELTEGEDV